MRSQEERSEAETLFVCEGKTTEQIAAQMRISAATIQRWSSQGAWAQQRRARRLESPRLTLDVLKRQRDLQIQELDGNMPAGQEAIDRLHKLSLVIEKMESRLEAVGPMLDVFERFAKYVGTHADANALTVLRTWTQKFLEEERRKGG
jgi:hypothetical protein